MNAAFIRRAGREFLGKSAKGFTLIELIVTMSIITLLMFVAVPGLTAFKRNAELTSASNTLLSAINAARSEALKAGRNALVVPTSNGTDWNTGWVVFVDMDQTQTYTSTDKTILVQEALPSYISVVGNNHAAASPSYIMYDASGYSKLKSGGFGGLALTLTRTDLSGGDLLEQTRYLIIAATGRARVCKPKVANDPECRANLTN